MQECCIFLNAFGPFSTLTPSGPKFLYNHTVGADARHRPVLAPEGSIGEKQKSVKNRAALLHGLAFLLLNLLFGVLRGEQPLRRASRAFASSGHFFSLPFWVSKKEGLLARCRYNKGLPQGGNPDQSSPSKLNQIQTNIPNAFPFPGRDQIRAAVPRIHPCRPHFAKKVHHIKAFRFYRM